MILAHNPPMRYGTDDLTLEPLQPPGSRGRLRALCPPRRVGARFTAMIDPPTDIARRLRRDARARRLASRFWAGWRLELTFGPFEQAVEPERAAAAMTTAAALFEQAYGKPPPADNPAFGSAASAEMQRDLWHLSVSWRGTYPAADGKRLLGELIVAMGVPEDKREGIQPMRVLTPGGASSPQVTHWIWREQARWGASRE